MRTSKRDDFAGLSGLAFLNLRDNRLTQLPQRLFTDLAALVELVLDRNYLGTLPADVFDPLAALTRLDLAGNSLRELPDGLFDNLSGLITLNISRNDIAALPEGVFDELGSLTELNLEGNPIAVVPEAIFTDLTELKILSLGDSAELLALTNGVFDDLSPLPFDVENHTSLTLTDGVFDGLEGLLWLRLRGVASLSADVFAGTPNLLELEVSDGALSSLPAGVFDNLSSLYKLNLEGNPLAALPEGIFANLTELKILSLGDSAELLTLTAGVFDDLGPLPFDVENHTSLTLTAGVFDGLEGLQWLVLYGVESLPADAFAGTPNLRQLDVIEGALSSLPAGGVRQPEQFDRAQPRGKSTRGVARRYLCQLDRAGDIDLERQHGVADANRRLIRWSGEAVGTYVVRRGVVVGRRVRGHTKSPTPGSFRRRAFELTGRGVRQPEQFDRTEYLR